MNSRSYCEPRGGPCREAMRGRRVRQGELARGTRWAIGRRRLDSDRSRSELRSLHVLVEAGFRKAEPQVLVAGESYRSPRTPSSSWGSSAESSLYNAIDSRYAASITSFGKRKSLVPLPTSALSADLIAPVAIRWSLGVAELIQGQMHLLVAKAVYTPGRFGAPTTSTKLCFAAYGGQQTQRCGSGYARVIIPRGPSRRC